MEWRPRYVAVPVLCRERVWKRAQMFRSYIHRNYSMIMPRYGLFAFYSITSCAVVLLFFLPFFAFGGGHGTLEVTNLDGGPAGGTPVTGTLPLANTEAGGVNPPTNPTGDGTVHSETPPSSLGMTVEGLLTRAEGLLNLIIPFLIGLAVFMILWGIFIYITKAAEEEKRAEARLYIVWGIVAVFSMLSLWGFVNILVNSFSLQTTFDASVVPD